MWWYPSGGKASVRRSTHWSYGSQQLDCGSSLPSLLTMFTSVDPELELTLAAQ